MTREIAIQAQPAPSDLAPTEAGRGERRLRAALALVLGSLLVIAALLPPVPAGAGGDGLTVAGHRLPDACAMYRTTGLPCPGCGLTRSWVAALHGDLSGSLGHHALGWLVLAYAVAQLGRNAAWLALPRRRLAVERFGRPLDRAVVAVAVLLLIAWIPRFFGALG